MSKITFYILNAFLVASFKCNSFTDDEQRSNNIAAAFQFPYVVAVLYANYTVCCTGFIVGEEQIVSAAHCLKKKLARFVMAGDIKVPKKGESLDHYQQLVNIRRWHKHPKYYSKFHSSEYTTQYDLAVVIVTPAFNFTNSTQIAPIAQSSPSYTEKCIVAGWGGKNCKYEKRDYLHYHDENIVDRSECKMSVYKILCGMDSKVCSEDYGSPLICNGAVAGMLSNAINAWDVKHALYVDIVYVSGWIEKAMVGLLDCASEISTGGLLKCCAFSTFIKFLN